MYMSVIICNSNKYYYLGPMLKNGYTFGRKKIILFRATSNSTEGRGFKFRYGYYVYMSDLKQTAKSDGWSVGHKKTLSGAAKSKLSLRS